MSTPPTLLEEYGTPLPFSFLISGHCGPIINHRLQLSEHNRLCCSSSGLVFGGSWAEIFTSI